LNIDKNKETVAPAFLVEGNSYEGCCKKVIHFLDQTALVKYDRIEFNAELSFSASDKMFWERVEVGLERNNQSVLGLINEMQRSGFNEIAEFATMKQGYNSKILHILVHFLDGFIGIDSSFYNLIEGSHQVSESLRLKIKQNPENFQLLHIKAENLWAFL